MAKVSNLKRGIVHSKDHKRTYIKVQAFVLSKDKHKHLFPGRMETKIVPSLKKRHHLHLKKGDRVHFEIRPKNNSHHRFIYYSLPILGIITGLIVGVAVTKSEAGILLMIGLFMLLGIALKAVIRKSTSIFREIDVHIQPVAKVEVFKAKNRKRR